MVNLARFFFIAHFFSNFRALYYFKEIIDAWTEGYFFLATLLIATEKKKKKERAEQSGNSIAMLFT